MRRTHSRARTRLGALVYAGLALTTPALARDLALGDSRAFGTGHALGITTIAKVGANSCWVRKHSPGGAWDRVVVSLGVNPPLNPKCVLATLQGLHTSNLVYLTGTGRADGKLHAFLAMIAPQFGFKVVSFTPGKDGLHPKSYGAVAKAVRRAWAH